MRRGSTTSTPVGATTIRRRRARSERRIVYSVTALASVGAPSGGTGRSCTPSGGSSALRTGDSSVDLCHLLRQSRPRITLTATTVGGRAHAHPLVVVVHDPDQRLGHRLLVVGRHQQARLAVVDDR